jgi:hypothetical protein
LDGQFTNGKEKEITSKEKDSSQQEKEGGSS